MSEHKLKKSNTRLIHYIEYSLEIDFSEQKFKEGHVTSFYQGKKEQTSEIEDDGKCFICLTKVNGGDQNLKIITQNGQSIIDLERPYSKVSFSGGGSIMVEVTQMEIPKEIPIGDEKYSEFLESENSINDSRCSFCSLI